MRLLTIRISLALAFGCVTASLLAAPAPPTEYWVYIDTVKGEVALRVGGGPPRQEAAKLPAGKDERRRMTVPGVFEEALPIDGGKRVVYSEPIPETFGIGKKLGELRHRLVVASAKGENPTTVFTGLGENKFHLATDGKSAVCGAEKGGKWDVYRVAFDGTPPEKVSKTHGVGCPQVLLLPDGRIVYHAAAGWHVEQLSEDAQSTCGEGPVLLVDGTTETVLVKRTHEGLPTFSANARKMAVRTTTVKGEAAVEVTDLKTGAAAVFPVSAFKKGWDCEFSEVHFSPDGTALAVTFGFGFKVLFNHTLFDHESLKCVGIVWLDGHNNSVALHHVEVLRQKHKKYPLIGSLEWGPPAVTK